MPSDEKLLSSRKVVPYGNKGQKEEYIIPKKYQDLEKSVIQETIAMNQNNAAYEEEQKQIKANNAAIEERLNLIRQSIKQNDKNSDYNGEYKMGLSLKASDRNKKDIFGMTSNLSQEEMLKEICKHVLVWKSLKMLKRQSKLLRKCPLLRKNRIFHLEGKTHFTVTLIHLQV